MRGCQPLIVDEEGLDLPTLSGDAVLEGGHLVGPNSRGIAGEEAGVFSWMPEPYPTGRWWRVVPAGHERGGFSCSSVRENQLKMGNYEMRFKNSNRVFIPGVGMLDSRLRTETDRCSPALYSSISI